MATLALRFSQIGVVCCALALPICAFFLYEDEEGRLQNLLQELWVKIDDLSRSAIAKHMAFLKQTVILLNSVLDSLFGTDLISVRSIAATLAYCAGSFFVLFYARIARTMPNGDGSLVFLRALLCFVVFMLLAASLSFRENAVLKYIRVRFGPPILEGMRVRALMRSTWGDKIEDAPPDIQNSVIEFERRSRDLDKAVARYRFFALFSSSWIVIGMTYFIFFSAHTFVFEGTLS